MRLLLHMPGTRFEFFVLVLTDLQNRNGAAHGGIRGSARSGFEMIRVLFQIRDDILDVTGTGVMGYIEIPSIDVELPIHHGTEENVLQVAVGHLDWTSFPVGGADTHCVLSAHRGLPSAKLFTDLDQLEEGDIFLLHVLEETLTYQVDQILTVEPQEIQELYIQPGQDLCTLVTCTPYGINTHRLLVRGHHIENLPDEFIHVTAEAIPVDPLLVAPLVAAPILLALVVIVLVRSKKK